MPQVAYHSKYKFFGALGVALFLNALSGLFCWAIFFNTNIDFPAKIRQDKSILIFILVVCFVEVMMILLFVKKCRYIVMEKDHVTFINPLLPFIRKRQPWTDYDFYYLVDERSRYSTYETIWMIKDNKLKKSISSFSYSNYGVLKRRIGIPSKGKLKINVFHQIGCYLGMKVPQKHKAK